MFDLFGISVSEIDEKNKTHAINYMALFLLLEEKGIITNDEYIKARIKTTSLLDQVWQKIVDENKKKFEEEYPGINFMKKIFGD
jgi:hypothetical protein